MTDEVNFRISAYQTGDRANPRYVWGVGIPTELLNQLPEDCRRVQLEADDDRLYVKLNSKGIKLGDGGNPNTALWWSSQIGLHHVNGLTTPDEVVRARGVTGYWDEESHRIVVDNPPDFVKRAMAQSIHHVPTEDELFPAQHFSEDVKEAAVKNATMPAFMTTVEEVIEKAHIESDPDSPTYQWFLAQVKKGQEAPFAEVVELTPELADILLRRNAGNRNIRLAKLNQYISDITNDRWQLNGETISVSREGELNNGQHRCSAVLAANKSIRTFMGFGLSRESRTTVDVGATRTPGDHLHVLGYKNSVNLAGITRLVLAYEASGEQRDLAYSNRITAAEINERVPKDPLLVEAAHFAGVSHKAKRYAPPSALGFVYYMINKADPEDAKAFMDMIIKGVGLEAGDPAYVVRETLLARSQLSRELKIEVFLRGWNAFRLKRKLRNIRILYELPPIR